MRQVYALIDPRRPTVIRYVGCSHRLPERVCEHVWEARRGVRRFRMTEATVRKVEWILSLLDEGLLPGFVILETVLAGENWRRREDYWIDHFMAPELFNTPLRPRVEPDPDEKRSRGWNGFKFW